MEEKRQFPRLSTLWDLTYRRIGSEAVKEELLKGTTVNISSGGIRFESDEELPEGTILAIELDSDVFSSPIIAVARTIWCRRQKKQGRYDVGVEFQWMGWQDLDVQQALSEYISNHDI